MGAGSISKGRYGVGQGYMGWYAIVGQGKL